MAFVTLTDNSGSIEGVVFPQLYAQSRDCWKVDQVVLCHGKVDYREDQLSLVIEKVIPAAQIPNPESDQEPIANGNGQTNTNFVVIPRRLDRNKLISLNSLLKDHPGEDHLTLIFENGNGGKPVPIPFGIDYSTQLQKQVVGLLKT